MSTDQQAAEQLSQAEIMDKLEQMHQEMFMAGHNSALRSVLPSLQHSLVTLNKLAEGLHDFLMQNDKEYAEQQNADAKATTPLDDAVQLSLLSEEAAKSIEDVKENQDN